MPFLSLLHTLADVLRQLDDDGLDALGAHGGGLIKIRRLDQAAADGQFYPATAGLAASVSAGDFVVCLALGGTVIVVVKVVTS